MLTYQNNIVKTSVRRLVEFLLRSGDIEKGSSVRANPEAMVLGAKLHRKIQRAQKETYCSEVSLKKEWQEDGYTLVLEGRADGIDRVSQEGEESRPLVIIDEIKCLFQDVNEMRSPQPLHLAQAKCYAAMYGSQEGLDQVGVQISYCNMETEEVRKILEIYSMEVLQAWFDKLIASYRRWAAFYVESVRKRDRSLAVMHFPFSYRKGQKKMMGLVHRGIEKGRPVMIQAPTGTGKTISALYPTLKALGAGMGERVFYLTAKTITRVAAQDTLTLLRRQGLKLHSVAITAKDRICILDEVDCNPESCPFARGHYDRINEALYAILSDGQAMTRDLFLEYAGRFSVCPYELSFEAAVWADVIICDYNYIFDPHANRKSLFAEGRPGRDIYLIDEAHNLLDRTREMYSAMLSRDHFLKAKRLMKKKSSVIYKRMETCDRIIRNMARETDGDWKRFEQVDALYFPLFRLMGPLEDYLADHPELEEREDMVQFYFEISHFFMILDHINDGYQIYGEGDGRSFQLWLSCIDPSENVREYVNLARSAVFFSATLFPVQYYRRLLGGEEIEAYRLPSPFPREHRIVAISDDVTSRYSRRGDRMYRRILRYLELTFEKMPGNYMIFFPSYQMMEAVAELAQESSLSLIADFLVQEPSMKEEERENFLDRFRRAQYPAAGTETERLSSAAKEGEYALQKVTKTGEQDEALQETEQKEKARPVIGFCVLGSIFSEGIDLTGRALLGALIVGTGLPMLCTEREVIRDYFDRDGDQGYNYAYRFPGVNKVLQAAGRVIRTGEDLGVLVLLDDRFLEQDYRGLLPEDWDRIYQVNISNYGMLLEDFWNKNQ